MIEPKAQKPTTNLPGNQCLGCGYDIFKDYASTTSTTKRLFQLGPQTTTVQLGEKSYLGYNEKIVTYTTINESKIQVISGESIKSYLQDSNVSHQVSGSYKAFSGSLKTSFGNSQFNQSQLHYTTVRSQMQKYLVRIEKPDTLTLDYHFDQNLHNPKKNIFSLFKQYGTHYLKEYIVGGRLDFSAVTNKSTYKSTSTIAAAAKASFSFLVGSVSLQNRQQFKKQVELFNKNSNISISSVGGDPSEAAKIQNSSKPKEQYDAWCDSVNKSFTMCNFTKFSLIPIWTLCRDPTRAKQLREAFPQYVRRQQLDNQIERPIEVHYTYDIQRCGSDAGSGSKFDCVYYKPKVGMNQYWLGHYVANSEVNMSLPFIRVLDQKIIASPVSYAMVWNDSGSKKEKDYSVWNPVPPPNYIALGCVLNFGAQRHEPPNKQQLRGLVCVHESAVQIGIASNILVWCDQGTKANRDCSIWPIVAKDNNGFAVSCFYGSPKNRSFDPNPCQPIVHVLDLRRLTLGSSIVKPEPKISIKYTSNIQYCGGDGGLGSKRDISYFRPHVGENQYWFGHTAVPQDVNYLSGSLPYTTSGDAVSSPAGYEQVWNDSGSKKQLDYSCWRIIPPAGFVSLGYLLRFRKHDHNPPSGQQIKGLVCVKQQFCARGEASRQMIWEDYGSKAKADLSVFEIIPSNNQGFRVNTFYGQNRCGGFNPNPTYPPVWVLKVDRVKLE